MATIEIQGKTPVIMRGIRQLLKGLYEWLQIHKELKKLRKQLEDKRQDTMLQAAKQLSTSDRADVNDHIRHIEAYDKLLAGMPQHRIVPALMIAFLCVTVAGIASSLHRSSLPIWNRTKLVLTVQVEAVQLKLAKQMEWGPKLPLPLHQDMRLQRFTEIQVPGSLVKSPERHAKVDIEGGQLSLARLSLGEESIVHIESHHNGLGKVEISVTSDPHHGAHFSGELGLGGAEKVVIGSDDGAVTHRLYPLMEPPETVTFKADVDPKRLTSAQLWMQPKEALVFGNLQVGDPLSFSKEVSKTFVSTIISGQLSLQDISQANPLELRQGDQLSLQGVKGQITEMRVTNSIHLRFEGSARNVRVGPKGSARDITPTILEYLYHNQLLVLVWSVVPLLWGILWSVREAFFR